MHGSIPIRSTSLIVKTFASIRFRSSRSPSSSERTPTNATLPGSTAGSGQPSRATDATIVCAVEGRGTSTIGDKTFAWGPRDIFVVPSWHPVTHNASEESVLLGKAGPPGTVYGAAGYVGLPKGVIGWGFPYLYDPVADARWTSDVLAWRAPTGEPLDGFSPDLETAAEGVIVTEANRPSSRVMT